MSVSQSPFLFQFLGEERRRCRILWFCHSVTVFATAFPGFRQSTRESKWETPVWAEMQEGNALFTILERLQTYRVRCSGANFLLFRSWRVLA